MKTYPWLNKSSDYFRQEFSEVLYQRMLGTDEANDIKKYLSLFKDVCSFVSAMKKAEITSIPVMIENRNYCKTIKEFDKETCRWGKAIGKVYTAVNAAIPIHRPIVLYIEAEQRYWLLSGNIRCNIAEMHGYEVEYYVLHIKKNREVVDIDKTCFKKHRALINFRLGKKWSTSEVAFKLGIEEAEYVTYESGKKVPKKIRVNLAELYNTHENVFN